MATITIPDSVKAYLPESVDPSNLWVNYDPVSDSLIIYFTSQPVPSVWDDVDAYAYIGFSLEDENAVTGVMIEHFSKWLLVSDPGRELETAEA